MKVSDSKEPWSTRRPGKGREKTAMRRREEEEKEEEEREEDSQRERIEGEGD